MMNKKVKQGVRVDMEDPYKGITEWKEKQFLNGGGSMEVFKFSK